MSQPPWPAPGRPNDWSGRDFPPRLPPPGPPPGWGGPPPFGPPPPPPTPFYQRAWFIVLAVFAGLAILTAVAKNGYDNTESTYADSDSELGVVDGDPTQPSESQPMAVIGQPADDGDFRFVIAGVKCGATTIGDEFFNQTAQGQFCIVDMTVTNIG